MFPDALKIQTMDGVPLGLLQWVKCHHPGHADREWEVGHHSPIPCGDQGQCSHTGSTCASPLWLDVSQCSRTLDTFKSIFLTQICECVGFLVQVLGAYHFFLNTLFWALRKYCLHPSMGLETIDQHLQLPDSSTPCSTWTSTEKDHDLPRD